MLKNFEVIVVAKNPNEPNLPPLNIIIDPKRVRFVKSVVEALDYPSHVRLLVNPKEQKFAVQVCKENDSNSFQFSKPKEIQNKAILIQNEVMIRIVRDLMPEWNDNTNYIVTGSFNAKEKAIIFDLKDAHLYSRKELKIDTRVK